MEVTQLFLRRKSEERDGGRLLGLAVPHVSAANQINEKTNTTTTTNCENLKAVFVQGDERESAQTFT